MLFLFPSLFVSGAVGWGLVRFSSKPKKVDLGYAVLCTVLALMAITTFFIL